MTDDEVLTDLESFNNAMVHFKEAVDTRGNEHLGFVAELLCDLRRRSGTNARALQPALGHSQTYHSNLPADRFGRRSRIRSETDSSSPRFAAMPLPSSSSAFSVDLHVSDKTKYNPEPFSQAIDQLALCLTAR